MSKTDKTRPPTIQEKDPHNRRFLMVGSVMWSTDGTSEHFWKKLNCCSCWMCGQKKTWKFIEGKNRASWRQQRQRILGQPQEQRDEIDVINPKRQERR